MIFKSQFSCVRVCLLGFLSVLSFPSLSSNVIPEVIKFELQPLACVTQYQGQKCKMTASLRWQTAKPADICFYQHETELKCWSQSAKSEFRFPIELETSTEFSLRLKSTKTVVATKQIKINFINKYRRRLRPQWSLF